MIEHLQRLHEAVAAVCPIDGISGVEGAIRIDYKAAATAGERAAAETALASFDWSQAAHDAWLADMFPERKALRQQAAQAIADNDAFLAISSPNNAQTLAQVKKLTQQNTKIINLLSSTEL
jgi:hypothetical protein